MIYSAMGFEAAQSGIQDPTRSATQLRTRRKRKGKGRIDMIVSVPQKKKTAPHSAELKEEIVEPITLRVVRKCRGECNLNGMIRIAEFKDPNDVLVVSKNAI